MIDDDLLDAFMHWLHTHTSVDFLRGPHSSTSQVETWVHTTWNRKRWLVNHMKFLRRVFYIYVQEDEDGNKSGKRGAMGL